MKSSSQKAKNAESAQSQVGKGSTNEATDGNGSRKCAQCGVSASEESKLRFCSKCHTVMYCSRECQVEDWKKHKKACATPAVKPASTQSTQLSTVDKLKKLINSYPLSLPNHPSGITWVELDSKLEQWVKYFGNVLMYSTVHALKLPLYFPRARTHLLRIVLLYNPNNDGKVGRFFDLDEVDVVLAETVARMDNVAKLNVDRLRTMSQESEREGNGLVSGVALLCKPLKVQMVPVGSITPPSMKRIKWLSTWEQNLKRCLENGDPIFDSGDA